MKLDWFCLSEMKTKIRAHWKLLQTVIWFIFGVDIQFVAAIDVRCSHPASSDEELYCEDKRFRIGSRFMSNVSYDEQVAAAVRVASFHAQRPLELEEWREKELCTGGEAVDASITGVAVCVRQVGLLRRDRLTNTLIAIIRHYIAFISFGLAWCCRGRWSGWVNGCGCTTWRRAYVIITNAGFHAVDVVEEGILDSVVRTHARRCVAPRVQQLELAEVQGGRTFSRSRHMLWSFLVQIKVLLDITFIALVRRPLVIAFIL